jgi:hypothetical protein
MSNSEPTEKQNETKFDLSGSLLELVQLIIAIDGKVTALDVETWVAGRKEIVSARWVKWFYKTLRIPDHDELEVTAIGAYPRLDFTRDQYLMDRDYLEEEFGYPKGRFPSNGSLNIMGEQVDMDDVGYQAKFNLMCYFSPKLVEDLMKLVRKIINSLTKSPPTIEPFDEDALGPVRFLQNLSARVFKLIIKNEAHLRKDHMKLLTMPIRSKADVSFVTSTIEARILIAMIVNQKTKESIDRELTQSFMSTVAELENVSERSRQAIKELQKILESKHS